MFYIIIDTTIIHSYSYNIYTILITSLRRKTNGENKAIEEIRKTRHNIAKEYSHNTKSLL